MNLLEMPRCILGLVAATVLLGGAVAQQLDPSRIQPVRVPVKDAGVFNWSTKQWVQGSQAALLKTSRTVYRNDCTWTGGDFFYTASHCEDLISQGSIPGPDSPGAPPGATWDNTITGFEFAYCTSAVTGSVDIKLGFYDTLGGNCAGLAPVRPPTLKAQALNLMVGPAGSFNAYFDFGSAAGNPLPGSTLNGKQACWSVGFTFAGNVGYCLRSEGNGTWDNDAALDTFSWSFRYEDPNTTFGLGGGPVIRGEPSKGGYGAGTYNIPPGSDGVFSGLSGGACGTGVGTGFDHFWINVDGSAPGTQNTIVNTTGVVCKGAPITGTNCYWFGGWPGNPLSAFWMVIGSRTNCNGCSNRVVNYCTAGTSTDGCQALLTATGSSESWYTTPFFLNSSNVQGSNTGTNGLFFYGANGRQANAWGSGTSFQCVVPPVDRSQSLNGGGSSGNCDASFQFDITARWMAKPAQKQSKGTVVQAQLWYRDPLNTSNQTTSLSNAIEWTVCQ